MFGVSRMPRFILSATLILLAGSTLWGCRGSIPRRGQAIVEINLPDQGEDLPGDGNAAAALYHSDSQTVTLLRAAEPIALHRHLYSEETVYMVSGEGTLSLGTSERRLRAGDFVVIPRNTPHGFTPHGDEAVVVLSMFTPAFQEGDRIFEP